MNQALHYSFVSDIVRVTYFLTMTDPQIIKCFDVTRKPIAASS